MLHHPDNRELFEAGSARNPVLGRRWEIAWGLPMENFQCDSAFAKKVKGLKLFKVNKVDLGYLQDMSLMQHL